MFETLRRIPRKTNGSLRYISASLQDFLFDRDSVQYYQRIKEKEAILMAFSLDSKVKDILKNPAAAAVLDKYSPDASRNPQMKLVGGLTLRKLASFPQSAFLKPHLEELDKELQAIE